MRAGSRVWRFCFTYKYSPTIISLTSTRKLEYSLLLVQRNRMRNAQIVSNTSHSARISRDLLGACHYG